jgi:polyphosphate glucokinase
MAKPAPAPKRPDDDEPRTLCIDIGGTGLKAMIVNADGKPLGERVRVETPRPALPKSVLAEIDGLVERLGEFDRVSCGFPGVVVRGVVQTAPNLHPSWAGVPLAHELEKRYRRPTRALNDAGVQGHGVIERHGTEMVLTLGTGLGCALFVDGHYVPNLELAHHPYRNGKSYEQFLGNRAFEKAGKKKWNKRVRKALAQIQPIFNPDRIYLGGGNAKHVKGDLPDNVSIVENVAGLLGGVKLWRDY